MVMATQAANSKDGFFQIWLAGSVLAVTALSIVVLGAVAYGVGAGVNRELRFFQRGERPTADEAIAVCPVEYALGTSDKNDVIFLGDSTCHTGADPRVFERMTGLVAYNLGSLRGVGASGFVITLKAYLLHHAKPRAVVLCVSPTCFEDEAARIGGPLPKAFAANYGPEVAEVVPPLERISYFCKRGVWSIWQPAFVDRLQGQDVRDVPLKGIKEEETYHTLQRKTLDGRGFFGLPGSHGPPKGIASGGDVVIREEWREGVERIAQICEEAGMTLVVVFAPVSADVARARNFGPLETLAGELESTFPHTAVVRPIVRTYDAPLMWDGLHLNSAGVEKFQASIAKNVQTALKR
jgi:hypothetical protein